jgi:hypothetical protein
MATEASTERGGETIPSVRAHPGRRVQAAGPSTPRRVAVVVGFILLPVGSIILASAPLLHPSGWTAAALVVGGASVLTVGIGLVTAYAHAEHPRARRECHRVGRNRGHCGKA